MGLVGTLYPTSVVPWSRQMRLGGEYGKGEQTPDGEAVARLRRLRGQGWSLWTMVR